METELDIGMQTIDKYQTVSSMDTMVSIGVAVPMNLPAFMSPTEVHNGRSAQAEPDSDVESVIGDHDEE
jgi:hypothetical protein